MATTQSTVLTDAAGYPLSRNEQESKRLNVQHQALINAQGYHLHPDISSAADKSSDTLRIAEIATGTAIFLLDLAKQPEFSKATLHGFDISAEQFPPASELPSNLSLHVLNCKEPFPDQFLGTYDIVHLRLIFTALATDEWVPFAKNLLTLLKPGGAIQWVEFDLMETSLSGHPTGHLDRWHTIFMDGLNASGRIAPRLRTANSLMAAGFEQVKDYRVRVGNSSNTRNLHIQMLACKLFTQTQSAMCKSMGGLNDEEYDALARGVNSDLAQGGTLVFHATVVTAFAPS